MHFICAFTCRTVQGPGFTVPQNPFTQARSFRYVSSMPCLSQGVPFLLLGPMLIDLQVERRRGQEGYVSNSGASKIGNPCSSSSSLPQKDTLKNEKLTGPAMAPCRPNTEWQAGLLCSDLRSIPNLARGPRRKAQLRL